MLRGLEAIAIACIAAITVVMLNIEDWEVVPGHHVTSERALAWILLVSDSAPYNGEIVSLSRKVFGDHLVELRYGSTRYLVEERGSIDYRQGVVYALEAVWLGYNGSINVVVVSIRVKP